MIHSCILLVCGNFKLFCTNLFPGSQICVVGMKFCLQLQLGVHFKADRYWIYSRRRTGEPGFLNTFLKSFLRFVIKESKDAFW